MRGKLINDPLFYPENKIPFSLLRDKEYLILGISEIGYLIFNESNRVDVAPIDRIEITDNTQPNFWKIDEWDNRRLLPEEWHWGNFLSMDGEPYLELWNYEIWSVTQFAKGLIHYDLPTFPINFKNGIDVEYKLNLINAYLKIAADYDTLVSDKYMSWDYSIGSFNRLYDMPYYGNVNGEPQFYKKELLTETKNGFEVLGEILKTIGNPFEYQNLKVNKDWLIYMRKRFSYAIWSLFGSNEFDIYKMKYEKGSLSYDSSYILKKDDNIFILSFDYTT